MQNPREIENPVELSKKVRKKCTKGRRAFYLYTYIYICSLPLFLSLSLLFLLCRGKTSQRLAIWNVSSTRKWGAFGPKSPFRLIKGWRCHKSLRKNMDKCNKSSNQRASALMVRISSIMVLAVACAPLLAAVERHETLSNMSIPILKKCNFRG